MMSSSYVLAPEVLKEIDAWIAKFPVGQKRSAVIMALRLVQDHYGWISDWQLDAVADYLEMPAIDVYEVVSFYTMYRRAPLGKYVIKVCHSVSCYLCGSGRIIRHLQQVLGIKLGQTTVDGLFTMQEAECLAACCQAPVMCINDEHYKGSLTPSAIELWVEDIRRKEQGYDTSS